MIIKFSVCYEFKFENDNRDVIYICVLLLRYTQIGWGLKPSLPSVLDHRIGNLLGALALPSLIAAELCHLLVAHDVPDAVRRQDRVPR